MKWFWLLMLWLKETVQGLYRNIWGNLTAVFLTVACLGLFSVSYVMGLNAEHFANILNDKIEITVEIKDELDHYDQLEEDFQAIKNVESVRFVSKEEAFEIMERDMKENADILYAVGENPFPAKFVLKVGDPDDIRSVVEQVESMDVSEKIQYGEGYVEDLVAFTKSLQKIGYYITLIAAIFTVYIVTNVLKYNIDKRKDEIRIKRLTGAGMVTIRFPFVMEALVLMAVSSCVVYYLFQWSYDQVETVVRHMISFAPFLPIDHVMDTLLWPLVGIAVAIGLLGSAIATQRFIHK